MSATATPSRGAVLGTTTLGGLKMTGAIAAFVLLVVVVAAASSPTFRTSTNVQSLLFAMAPLLIVAAGQALVVLTAGIDLSVGSMIGLATVVAASGASLTSPAAVLVVLVLVGIAGGLINGGGVLFGINPLVMTLATMAVFKGVALLVLDEPGGVVPEGLLTPLTMVYGTVPLTFLVALGVVAVLWLATSETRWGRLLYAIGEDQRHVERMRLPWRRALLTAYVVCGLCAALAGLALVARIYSGDALVGEPYALDSITAAVIGGIAVTGGRGSVLAVIPAVVLLALIDNLLNLGGVSTYYQLIAKGAILIVTLWAYHAAGNRGGVLGLLRRPAVGRTA